MRGKVTSIFKHKAAREFQSRDESGDWSRQIAESVCRLEKPRKLSPACRRARLFLALALATALGLWLTDRALFTPEVFPVAKKNNPSDKAPGQRDYQVEMSATLDNWFLKKVVRKD